MFLLEPLLRFAGVAAGAAASSYVLLNCSSKRTRAKSASVRPSQSVGPRKGALTGAKLGSGRSSSSDGHTLSTKSESHMRVSSSSPASDAVPSRTAEIKLHG